MTKRHPPPSSLTSAKFPKEGGASPVPPDEDFVRLGLASLCVNRAAHGEGDRGRLAGAKGGERADGEAERWVGNEKVKTTAGEDVGFNGSGGNAGFYGFGDKAGGDAGVDRYGGDEGSKQFKGDVGRSGGNALAGGDAGPNQSGGNVKVGGDAGFNRSGGNAKAGGYTGFNRSGANVQAGGDAGCNQSGVKSGGQGNVESSQSGGTLKSFFGGKTGQAGQGLEKQVFGGQAGQIGDFKPTFGANGPAIQLPGDAPALQVFPSIRLGGPVIGSKPLFSGQTSEGSAKPLFGAQSVGCFENGERAGSDESKALISTLMGQANGVRDEYKPSLLARNDSSSSLGTSSKSLFPSMTPVGALAFNVQSADRMENNDDDMDVIANPQSLYNTTTPPLMFTSLHIDTGSSVQQEDEHSFTRCLDSGVRSTKITEFCICKDAELKQFTVFAVVVETVPQSWIVWRRYSDFMQLSMYLGVQSPGSFPSKTPFGGNFNKDFLQKRQGQLSIWLQKALSTPGVVTLPEIRMFLVSGANRAPENVTSSSSASSTPVFTSTKAAFGLLGQITSPVDGFVKFLDPSLVPPQQYSAASAARPPPPLPNLAEYDSAITMSSNNSSAVTSANNSICNDDDYITTSISSSTTKLQPTKKVSLDDFEMLQVLGRGSFGKVVLSVKKTGRDVGTLFAMKILKKNYVVVKKQVEHTLTERSVLGKMNHPFIVKLHYAFQNEKKLYFVLDFCPGGELFFHLGREGRFSEERTRFYAAEITLALGHLHANGVVYRDLKPENILFDARGHIKLADFGLSKEGIESGFQGSNSFCGTPEYLAPEVLNRTGHGTAVDWWSLGALLYEMLTGLPPWYSQDRNKLFAGIRQAPLKFPPEVSVLARSILGDLLKREVLERLGTQGVEQVKRHPFFASMDFVALYELRIPPLFVPKLMDATDTNNFETNFTRLPVHSADAVSPLHVMSLVPSAAVFPAPGVSPNKNQQHAVHPNHHQHDASPALFNGFTYQDDGPCFTPPSTMLGLRTPPPLPNYAYVASKPSSPMKPGPITYHARPSSSPTNAAAAAVMAAAQQGLSCSTPQAKSLR